MSKLSTSRKIKGIKQVEKMNKTAILVVTYNRKQFLKENIEAVLKQSYGKFDLIICDNNSNDGTEEMVAEYVKKDCRVKYFNTGANLGGAGGFNYGLKYIYGQEYDYCWVMDDDAIPNEDALESFMKKTVELPEHSFSFLASVVLWTDGKPCYMNQMVIEEAKIYKYLQHAKCGLVPVVSCSFVGCFIDLYYGRKAGLPIKEFFIYGDDAEFTMRLSEHCQGYMDTGSIIIHKMATNTKQGVAEALESRIDRYQYDYRNQVYISRYRKKEKSSKLLARYAKECVKVLVRSKNKKMKRIGVIVKGYREGRKFRPEVEMGEKR